MTGNTLVRSLTVIEWHDQDRPVSSCHMARLAIVCGNRMIAGLGCGNTAIMTGNTLIRRLAVIKRCD
jgi:hypothetical protein